MGMFSWICKGCGLELHEGELVRLNGCKGTYDGYGRAGGFDADGDLDPRAWHEACYQAATSAQKLDETPSKHAPNQGFGFALEKYMPHPERTKGYQIAAYKGGKDGAEGRFTINVLGQPHLEYFSDDMGNPADDWKEAEGKKYPAVVKVNELREAWYNAEGEEKQRASEAYEAAQNSEEYEAAFKDIMSRYPWKEKTFETLDAAREAGNAMPQEFAEIIIVAVYTDKNGNERGNGAVEVLRGRPFE